MGNDTFIVDNIAFTRYSMLTTLLIFTVLAFLGVFLVRKGGWKTLPFLAIGLLLSFIRFCLPIEIAPAKYIPFPQFTNSIFLFFEQERWHGISILNLVNALWLIVAAILLIRLVCRSVWQSKTIHRTRLPETDCYFAICMEVGTAMGCRKKPEVCVWPKYSSPMMAGFFRPRIILPDYAEESHLRLALRHEYAHFLGKDLFIKMAMNILCCLLWWHPVAYLLRSSVSQALEMRSDARACKGLSQNERFEFGVAMCRFARSDYGKEPAITASSRGQPVDSSFCQRINEIAHDSKASIWCSALLLLISIVLFVGSYIFIFQPYALPPEDGVSEYTYEEQDAFIIRYEDGKIEYYCDGHIVCYLDEEDLNEPPYNTIPVYDASPSYIGD